MRKSLAGCFVALLTTVLGVAACGGADEPKPDDQQPPKEEEEPQWAQARQTLLPDEKEDQQK